MKKLLATILVIVMIASLAACGKKEDTNSGGSNEPTKEAEATKPAETTPEATPEATPKTTPEVTEEPAATEEPTEAPAVDTSLGDLVGSWSEINSLFSRTLVVNEDGSMELKFPGGGAMYGSVSVQVKDDGNAYYIFSDTEGNAIAEFPKNISDDTFVLNTAEDGDITFQRNTNPEPTVNFEAIAGNWKEEEDVTGWEFEIHNDGSWVAYRGEEEASGDIVIKPYGMSGIPYTIDLREFTGDIWTTISWDWSTDTVERLNAMDHGDGGVWYVRNDGFEEFPENVPGDEYCGTYQCDRASMEVMREGAGAFIFTIKWANSASEWIEWQYWTNYDEASDAFHTNGGNVKFKCTTNEDGEEDRELISDKEEADFSPYENLMFWIDQTGDIEGEMQFVKVS